MLYLGIDQHAQQLTIDLGDESGEMMVHRKVSTKPKLLKQFLEDLRTQAGSEGYLAIVEVTGFNDYLLDLLPKYGCCRVVIVQPVEHKRRKTDRRDARQLRDLLWANRHRVLSEQRLPGVRVVTPANAEQADQRQLTSLMRLLRKQRTQVINRMHTILKKHNLQHDMPAKNLDTATSQSWLRSLTLVAIDGLERDVLQSQLRQLDSEIRKVDAQLRAMFLQSQPARIVASTPGISVYGGLAISSRLGDIKRFANGDSMANFVGLTPSCRNSDAAVRHGGVTKLGSSFVRFFLSQGLVHVLRKDGWLRRWYQRIKKRRGSSVARVAVMRRLVTMLYAMLRDQMPYVPGGPQRYCRLLAMREHQQLSYEQVESLAFNPQV